MVIPHTHRLAINLTIVLRSSLLYLHFTIGPYSKFIKHCRADGIDLLLFTDEANDASTENMRLPRPEMHPSPLHPLPAIPSPPSDLRRSRHRRGCIISNRWLWERSMRVREWGRGSGGRASGWMMGWKGMGDVGKLLARGGRIEEKYRED